MATERKDGGPAFPRDHAPGGQNGMTLRDYFAAKAMQALLNALAQSRGENASSNFRDEVQALSEMSFFMADAMLKAREA